jgi:hypothetical protein
MVEARGVDLKCLVFLRSDIHEQLERETPDKGKDTVIRLDWEDPAVFEKIIERRIQTSTGLSGGFRDLWPQVCVPLVGTQDSFGYIVDRTMMRPRDLLQFLHRAVDAAINRGHSRVLEEDLLHAERGYSEDMLLATTFEIQDTNPDLGDVLYAYQSCPEIISVDEAKLRLLYGNVPEERAEAAIELLIWYGFFGIQASTFPDVRFAHSVQGNLRRLLHPLEMGDASLVIHPAFHSALNVETTG